MSTLHTEDAIKSAIVAALTSERVGGIDASDLSVTIAVYPDEAAAVAEEVIGTLRNEAAAAVTSEAETREAGQ